MDLREILAALSTAGGAGITEYGQYQERAQARKTAAQEKQDELALQRQIAAANQQNDEQQIGMDRLRLAEQVAQWQREMTQRKREFGTDTLFRNMPYDRPTANEVAGNTTSRLNTRDNNATARYVADRGADSRETVGGLHWGFNDKADPRVQAVVSAGQRAYDSYKRGIPQDKWMSDEAGFNARAKEYSQREEQRIAAMQEGFQGWDPTTNTPVFAPRRQGGSFSFSQGGSSVRAPVGSSGPAPSIAGPSRGRRRGFTPINP